VGWKVRKLGWKMWVTYPIMRKTSSMMRSVTCNTVKKNRWETELSSSLFPFLSCHMDRSIELHETQLGWDPIELEPSLIELLLSHINLLFMNNIFHLYFFKYLF
jgi:hypothetical protein